jgi:hypothetical protein
LLYRVPLEEGRVIICALVNSCLHGLQHDRLRLILHVYHSCQPKITQTLTPFFHFNPQSPFCLDNTDPEVCRQPYSAQIAKADHARLYVCFDYPRHSLPARGTWVNGESFQSLSIFIHHITTRLFVSSGPELLGHHARHWYRILKACHLDGWYHSGAKRMSSDQIDPPQDSSNNVINAFPRQCFFPACQGYL